MSLNNQLNIAKLFAEANNEPMEEGTALEKTTADNLPDETPKFPKIEISRLKFYATHPNISQEKKNAYLKELFEFICKYDMAPFYEDLCLEYGLKKDEQVLKQMKEKNEKRLSDISKELEDAEINLGETEVRQALQKRAEYLCQIGCKEKAVEAFEATFAKTVGIGLKIDIVFCLVRMGLFFNDSVMIEENITRAQKLIEEGGDWERKNRLRSYEAIYKLANRDYERAGELFVAAVPTFSAYELMSYEDLVFYTILTTMATMPRRELAEKVINCNDIQEQISYVDTEKNAHTITAGKFLRALYDCNYDKFLKILCDLEDKFLIIDPYFYEHIHYYSRHIRLVAYEQFLRPYASIKIQMMADSFGIPKEILDKELHEMAASGLLNCRIDSVEGNVVMHVANKKTSSFKILLKEGDAVINRIQKLSSAIYN
ncbi:Proteasome component (PCI) domain and Winged helix-turn-helix DNA-binding domain and 26S proteasome, regulatory subunit Rpn7 family-containing protein [Strongyloides ratti]|uniref:Proteasome component (PCI) domain and Winged helix-turn-helix DNA-binding domain and 26S proteasome, regulatory subunit Rpn7 family-containing protein n=1 Tax=Strongyloides ratti TaxID=34506 RepID=A0A090L3B9_STRRB|nr:Proteasome component (PCI) domain and Winged helix-turn-helix DNA-binding domain and 26S proteasome, regulatory subunit Rpn7 family-containing protein [Strongyloides ratti]CEF64301.1 Proteasome component (PCI) domain and Winged helix-turn-helix DNA-binding domain and 26S proteasome, regulatory subunit Rpn7 family-containing protein [Strongyloides ratti]